LPARFGEAYYGPVSVLGDSERRRRLAFALGVYVCFTAGALLFAAPGLASAHTPYNHFALLAESWLSGRLDLGGPPPLYTGNNDFARVGERYYVVFPPFPALLLLPLVWLAGSAERVPDGLFFILLSGVGPALLFLALEKLRRSGDSLRSERENLGLSALFGFGTVYFFSAVQGTVWFAAHVVSVALAALYLRFALGGERPFAAGLALALAFATRTPLLFAAPLFVFEAVRAAAPATAPCPLEAPLAYVRSLAGRRLTLTLGWFALPLGAVLLLTFWHNAVRFGDPFEVGYRYLTVVWQARIEKWGLFSYHYLAKNLGIILTSLPWVPGERGAPFTINHHGLALWVTTPLYWLLLWPKRRPKTSIGLGLAALGAALPSLFYQNTGWLQFGYRFSNDYAPFLFALLALGGWSFRRGVLALALWSVLVNAFGALSFDRADYAAYYFTDPTQRIVYQPD
jgi:hypothetical protein